MPKTRSGNKKTVGYCLYCGVKLPPETNKYVITPRRYCCHDHKKRASRWKNLEEETIRFNRPCLFCGGPVKRNRKSCSMSRKYCSPKCRYKAENYRRKMSKELSDKIKAQKKISMKRTLTFHAEDPSKSSRASRCKRGANGSALTDMRISNVFYGENNK